MTELLTQSLVLLARASECVPTNPSANTLAGWAREGVRGVKLRTWMVGGRRFTSTEAVAEFLAELNGAASDPQRGTN